MLDSYCASLSDEAQLKIMLRLAKLAAPVWNNHFASNPDAIDKVNALMDDTNRINGGSNAVDIQFPERALTKIERSFTSAKEKSADKPIPMMKSDATLSPLLATCMQPLSNKQWDNTLPQSVRLVFTSVFNVLVWILYRRRTADKETHIYVAINQAADVLLRESLKTVEDLNKILSEYKNEKCSDSEEEDWEKAFGVGRGAPMEQEDIYKKFLGEPVFRDQCGRTLAKEVLRQMREESRTYWNEMDEYTSGISKTYRYNPEKQSFWRNELDTIVAGAAEFAMSEKEMLDYIAQQSLYDLRESGFEV
jgi:hypothetical protein